MSQTDEELRKDIARYVAALAESGANFMKPEMVSQDVREGYVNSFMRLIKERDAAKELEGAKTAERIMRSSPDPKADFQKYIGGLEKSNG